MSPVRPAQHFDLGGALSVVTGASSGLGRRFAVDMAKAGATVVGIARRTALLEELGQELRLHTPKSDIVTCDVADTAAFSDALAAIGTQHGAIDVLVNAAGIGEPRRPDRTLADFESVMAVNYFAPVAGTLAVLAGMKERGRGVVVNVSSDSGRAPGPDEVAYGPSKAALSAFTESMAMRLWGSGVHLHVLYPGWVPTAMGQGAVDEGMAMPPKMVRRTEEQVSRLLLERIGGPRIDIDAAAVARMAPVARALFPGLYRRGLQRAAGGAADGA